MESMETIAEAGLNQISFGVPHLSSNMQTNSADWESGSAGYGQKRTSGYWLH
jgi:hypothetical protein